jgi:hypothetical protein
LSNYILLYFIVAINIIISIIYIKILSKIINDILLTIKQLKLELDSLSDIRKIMSEKCVDNFMVEIKRDVVKSIKICEDQDIKARKLEGVIS